MVPPRSWTRSIPYVLAFCLMVSALIYLFFGETAVAQSIRLSRIQQYKAALTPKLAAETRYKSLQVGTGTANGGGVIVIQGILASDADLQELKALVAATQPPAHVDYRVVVSSR